MTCGSGRGVRDDVDGIADVYVIFDVNVIADVYVIFDVCVIKKVKFQEKVRILLEQTDTYDITPDKSLVKKLGMAGYRTAQALAELVDNSIDARIPDERQEIVVRLDFKGMRIMVEDNGAGMDDRELADAMTIAKETQGDRNEKLGRFGIGMKSACSALGKRFEITTSKGSGSEYHTKYDEREWLSDEKQGWKNLRITSTVDANKGEGEDGRWHGTKITISNLSVPLYPNQVSYLRENFGIRYSPYLESGQITLGINTAQCRPVEQDIEPGSTIKLQVPLDFGREITGHLALLKKRSIRGNYGIHLFWKRRLIKAFAKVGFRAHPENAKIVGSVNLDHVPVNYTKSGFLEESREYMEAVRKLGASEQMRAMLRKSATAGVSMPSVRSVFEHAVAGTDDGYEMRTRVRAELSMESIASTKPFAVRYGKHKRVDVRVGHKGSSAPLYVADTTGEEGGDSTTRISINADSHAFRFVKNPLFLIGMIASESKLLASHPEMAGLLDERNRAMTGLLSRRRRSAGSSAPPASGEERWRRRYSFFAESGSYGLSPELVEAHDILVDRHEFKFQFTALSTLSSYMHDLGGKLVYTVHTIPPHGEGIVELLAGRMREEFAVVDRPSAATIEALLRVPRVRRVLAVREYAQITGSTIATPAKAFVDLMTESSAREALMVDAAGLRRILEGMLRLGAVDLGDVRRYARASRCTRQLDGLLEKEALQS